MEFFIKKHLNNTPEDSTKTSIWIVEKKDKLFSKMLFYKNLNPIKNEKIYCPRSYRTICWLSKI